MYFSFNTHPAKMVELMNLAPFIVTRLFNQIALTPNTITNHPTTKINPNPDKMFVVRLALSNMS